MSKRIFTKEEVEALLQNKRVERCSEKSVTFTKVFKIEAVERYHEQGLTPREIFRQAGFDACIISSDQAIECLRRWRRAYKMKGPDGLEDTRGRLGGRPKTKGLTEADIIKRLEAEVAYLKAENDFLAKLRAKRRE